MLFEKLYNETISDFILYSSSTSDFSITLLNKLKISVDYFPMHDFIFDPLYRKLSENISMQLLNSFMWFGQDAREIDKSLTRYKPDKAPIEARTNLDPNLKISRFISKFKIDGIHIFDSHLFIEDLLIMFLKYYLQILPDYSEEIKSMFDCYKELFFVSEGRISFEIQSSKLLDYLNKKFPPNTCKKFISRFIYNKRYDQFPIRISDFNSQQLISEYEDFILCGCISYHGKFFSGAYWIWMSFLKYLEELQKINSFRVRKGKLLESWAFEITQAYDFIPYRIILTNNQKNPNDSSYYRSLKQNIQQEPNQESILEFSVPFPKFADSLYYVEIDLAFKLQDCLFIFECKSTSVPRAKPYNLSWWTKNLIKNWNKAELKEEIIMYNVRGLDHSIFDGINKIASTILISEGIWGYSGVVNTFNFPFYLSQIKSYGEKNEIDTFLNRFIKKYIPENNPLVSPTFSLYNLMFKAIIPMKLKIETDPELRRKFYDKAEN